MGHKAAERLGFVQDELHAQPALQIQLGEKLLHLMPRVCGDGPVLIAADRVPAFDRFHKIHRCTSTGIGSWSKPLNGFSIAQSRAKRKSRGDGKENRDPVSFRKPCLCCDSAPVPHGKRILRRLNHMKNGIVERSWRAYNRISFLPKAGAFGRSGDLYGNHWHRLKEALI